MDKTTIYLDARQKEELWKMAKSNYRNLQEEIRFALDEHITENMKTEKNGTENMKQMKNENMKQKKNFQNHGTSDK